MNYIQMSAMAYMSKIEFHEIYHPKMRVFQFPGQWGVGLLLDATAVFHVYHDKLYQRNF
jgi:hypothetical protein